MSVNTIPSRGYGTFGDIAEVTTGGYFNASAISAALGGTTALTEAQVVAGGETTTITLNNDTWAATLGADNAITDAFIAGFDSDGVESNGWNNTVRDASLTFNEITRTSDTVVTIVWPATPAYDADTDETITVTLDASTLVTSSSDLTAVGSITVATTVEVAGDQQEAPSYRDGGALGRAGQRKKKLDRDEQDFLDIVNLAIPEIMKYLK